MYLTQIKLNKTTIVNGSFILLLIIITVPTVNAIDWPSSFTSGQAEFEFTRKDLDKADTTTITPAARGKVTAREIGTPTMSMLIRRDLIDPFNIEEKQETLPLLPQLPVDITVPDLPMEFIQEKLDLEEFRNYLRTIVTTESLQSSPEVVQRDFKKDLSKIVISSMMVTPTPYVVINNQRFSIGDRFLMPIHITDNEPKIIELINAQMPSSENISEKTYKQFELLRDEAINNYRIEKAKRQADSNANAHNISVTITAIKHRKVMLSVDGVEYVLPIKMAL